MPRSAADNQIRRDATRTRLIDAALELFGRRGYASTPVDAVARAAGVSPGLLYHHFRGKSDLLHAIFEESMRDVDATFADADREPDPARRLAALLRSIAAHVKARRRFWMLAYGVRMQPDVLAGLDVALDASTTRILTTLERYLGGAGWPEARLEAVLLFAQIDGLHQHYVLNPEQYPLDAAIERLIARYSASSRGLIAARSSASSGGLIAARSSASSGGLIAARSSASSARRRRAPVKKARRP